MLWYGQSRDNGGVGEPLDSVLWSFVDDIQQGFMVEAGAGDGLWLSNSKAFEEAHWRCMLIEATTSLYCQLVSQRPQALCLNRALWNHDDELLTIDEYSDESVLNTVSTLTKHPQLNGKAITGTSKVSSVRYSTIVHCPVDLFVLDVEGAELKAIQGMEGTSYWPRIICVEHTHVGIDPINDALKLYKLYWLDEMNGIWIRKDIVK